MLHTAQGVVDARSGASGLDSLHMDSHLLWSHIAKNPPHLDTNTWRSASDPHSYLSLCVASGGGARPPPLADSSCHHWASLGSCSHVQYASNYLAKKNPNLCFAGLLGYSLLWSRDGVMEHASLQSGSVWSWKWLSPSNQEYVRVLLCEWKLESGFPLKSEYSALCMRLLLVSRMCPLRL